MAALNNVWSEIKSSSGRYVVKLNLRIILAIILLILFTNKFIAVTSIDHLPIAHSILHIFLSLTPPLLTIGKYFLLIIGGIFTLLFPYYNDCTVCYVDIIWVCKWHLKV